MRIVDVTVWKVDASWRNWVFLRVETDSELVGYGECTVEGREHAVEGAVRDMARRLVGRDPRRIRDHLDLLTRRGYWDSGPIVSSAAGGIEMALWDILGKALDTPVYTLLGGKVRERIPLSYSVPFGEPKAMAEYALERVREGHRTVKVKVGNAPNLDVEAVQRVREAIGPAVRLRVDANMAWSTAKEAIRLIRAMEPWDLELVEQPLPPRELDAMAEVRRAIGVPLMVDESIRTPRDAMEVIRRGAADIANVYVSEAGGLLNASRIFTLCEAAGMPCMIGSMPEFGIGTAAQIHLGVAMTNLGPDSDTCGVLYHAEDLLARPLRIEAGWAHPPEGPGLGVEIDMNVLERWRRNDPPGERG
jgi:L-alanine-DL-glutamate epimerase-like enolase superfamily enzyme